MSVRLGLTTATCMLPVSMCLEALNVAVEMVGLEMASSVLVSIIIVMCFVDQIVLQREN